MDLTNTIRTLRESKGLTQEDLADRFGVTRSNYAYLEGRGNKLTIEQLEKIAGALGVTVIELLTGEGQKVQDSEEVERLRKRNEELEDRIKDKESLISLYRDRFATAVLEIENSLINIQADVLGFKDTIESNVFNLEGIRKDILIGHINSLDQSVNIMEKVLDFYMPYIADSQQYRERMELLKSLLYSQEYKNITKESK